MRFYGLTGNQGFLISLLAVKLNVGGHLYIEGGQLDNSGHDFKPLQLINLKVFHDKPI